MVCFFLSCALGLARQRAAVLILTPLLTRVGRIRQRVWQGPRIGFGAETETALSMLSISFLLFILLIFLLVSFFPPTVFLSVFSASWCCFVREAVFFSTYTGMLFFLQFFLIFLRRLRYVCFISKVSIFNVFCFFSGMACVVVYSYHTRYVGISLLSVTLIHSRFCFVFLSVSAVCDDRI